jgi:esterase/lipase
VIDDTGGYSVYSPTARERRKHHKGAAVIALTLAVFKTRILSLHETGDQPRLERWTKTLELGSVEELVGAARKPTLIIPANITFYPIRATDNVLRKWVELVSKNLPPRIAEELLIEGNILLKNTDMDVRLEDPISPRAFGRRWDRKIIDQLFLRMVTLDDLFALNRRSERWIDRLFSMFLTRQTERLRDAYMRKIYSGVTVNLSHLTSRLIYRYVDSGQDDIACDLFNRALYLAIKNIQKEPSVHLHRSLTRAEAYLGTEHGHARGLDEFWSAVEASGLVEREGERYRFLPKLRAEHAFHKIRLENIVAVYANEVAPIAGVRRAVERAADEAETVDEPALAHLRFDDELRMHAWCRQTYWQPRHRDINGQETATESAEPYLLLPKNSNGLGAVLVHGFLASPAELKGLGEKLAALGHPVIGVRLAGHGTSPWDLRDRSWGDWLASVKRGYEIMSAFAERICIVGFSTGGSLALIHAADRPDGLSGLVSVSAPVHFRNKNLIFVPLVHGINKVATWVSNLEGLMPFRVNESEHPAINYRNMPIRGLYELRLIVDELKRRLPDVVCPVRLIQASGDNIVDPKSVDTIFERIGSDDKSVHMVDADRHGIVTEDLGGTHDAIIDFFGSLRAGRETARPGHQAPREAARATDG